MIAHHVPVTSGLMPSKKLRPKFKYSLILGDSPSLSLSVPLNPLKPYLPHTSTRLTNDADVQRIRRHCECSKKALTSFFDFCFKRALSHISERIYRLCYQPMKNLVTCDVIEKRRIFSIRNCC